MKLCNLLFALSLSASLAAASGQTPLSPRTPAAASAPTAIPSLVPFTGTAVSSEGKPLAGEASMTFMIFKDEAGGEPLWTESQTAAVDSTGHYKVQLGAANPNGLPSDLFANGEARWLEIQIAGEAQQPRVLLASVPYALKAADATTLGGLPASAFALAGAKTASASGLEGPTITSNAASNVTTTGGTANTVAKFSGSNTIVNSILYDNGTEVGIGTTTPSATLTVDGTMTLNGASTLNGGVALPAQGTATASKSYSSQYIKMSTSAYNSSTKAVVAPRFQLMGEVTGNNTASPNGTLNLLASAGPGAPSETGLYFNTNGTVHFASGQTFPGTGAGTITGVTAGTGLTGGGTSGKVTLNLNTSTIPTLAANNTFTGSNVFVPSLYEETDVNIDINNANSGNISPGLRLGSASGEGMASKRTSGGNQFGVDLYTGYSPRLSINSSGQVAIGTGATFNGAQFQVQSASGDGGDFSGAVSGSGVSGTGGSPSTNTDPGWGGYFQGGNAISSASANGGIGVYAVGGAGGDVYSSGVGIEAVGGYSNAADGDYGMIVEGGTSNTGLPGLGLLVQPGFNSSVTGTDAGDFGADVYITGTLHADAKDFQIDHPSDPANKYLSHASVESSEMMDIYSGNVTTDELGLATVTLPGWFQTLNTDFRYQLTVVGGRFAQAIVSKEIAGNQFTISTNASTVKVSWQVTAVRQDAYAKAHPLVVEQDKGPRERGFYKHPELYGQPAEKQIVWGTHPETMRRLKAMREAQKSRAKTTASSLQAQIKPAASSKH
jgi:hypothetical protein